MKTSWPLSCRSVARLSSASLLFVRDQNPADAYKIYSNGTAVAGGEHAVEWQDGKITDLSGLQGGNSAAYSINDSGQIVGVSSNDTDAQRAFLYETGQMYDLNSLIDPASPLTGLVSLQDAVGISANGLIAVNGTDSRDPGWTRAFLLIPAQ